MHPGEEHVRATRLALAGLLANALLAGIKLAAGVVGNSYALIADAVESLADIAGSALIWGGLRVAARPRSEHHPYGYGKAEPLAALAVALLIIAAGLGIAVEAVREILTPHHAPEWWTLLVLVLVVGVKETMFRVTRRVARRSGSVAVETDSWHHRADALTSGAAFIGISVALVGNRLSATGTGWEPADDWAALFASVVIVYNGVRLVLPPWRELLDVHAAAVGESAERTAARVPGVRRVQKVFARKSGAGYFVDMHLWVDPEMSVRAAHALSHEVKDAVRRELPAVHDVLIHVEPASGPL